MSVVPPTATTNPNHRDEQRGARLGYHDAVQLPCSEGGSNVQSLAHRQTTPEWPLAPAWSTAPLCQIGLPNRSISHLQVGHVRPPHNNCLIDVGFLNLVSWTPHFGHDRGCANVITAISAATTTVNPIITDKAIANLQSWRPTRVDVIEIRPRIRRALADQTARVPPSLKTR